MPAVLNSVSWKPNGGTLHAAGSEALFLHEVYVIFIICYWSRKADSSGLTVLSVIGINQE